MMLKSLRQTSAKETAAFHIFEQIIEKIKKNMIVFIVVLFLHSYIMPLVFAKILRIPPINIKIGDFILF